MIEEALHGICFAFLLMFVLGATFYGWAKKRSRSLTANIGSFERGSQSYVPQTGDIVLMQYESAGLQLFPKDFRSIPTHCGLVWNNKKLGLCVIEATRFGGKNDLEDVLWGKTLQHKDGVRVVKMEDMIKSVEIFISVRPIRYKYKTGNHLQKLLLSDERILTLLETWARNLRFEAMVSSQMGPLEILTLGFGPLGYATVFDVVTKMSAKACGLSSNERTGLFCSEFLTTFLQKLGILDKHFQEHFLIAPLSLTSNSTVLESISSSFGWDRETCLKTYHRHRYKI